MYDYQEACPVSRAASILCERWTLQIIREMLLGATRFSEFQKYLPRMSPSLLNARLRTLEDQGIIIRSRIKEKKGFEYQLTPVGLALKPLLHEFGKWGMQHAFEQMDPEQLNQAALVRDFAVTLDTGRLPAGDTTIQFNIVKDGEQESSFILVRDGSTQICDENIGCDVDVYLTADRETLGKLWYGQLTIRKALDNGLLKAVGTPYLVRNLHKWLGNSQFAQYSIPAE